jgi:NAD-dependent DNA ligase
MNTKLETLVMAHRYLYYVLCEPVISDQAYDLLERKARKKCSANSPVHGVGSSLESSYTQEQINKALELQQ